MNKKNKLKLMNFEKKYINDLIDALDNNAKVSQNYERKFIDTIEIDEWEVLSNCKWQNIKAIGKTIEYDEYLLRTKSCYLKCADTHIVFTIQTGYPNEIINEKFVKDLNKEDYIITKYGPEQVLYLEKTGQKVNMYDLELDEYSNHTYYTNDILSHNSMWLHNISTNVVNMGKNVVILTLEMSSRKVMKRLGAMRLKIPVNDYDEISKDSTFIKSRINSIKQATSNGLFGGENPGKIRVKKYNTGDCTITDIDLYLKNLIEVAKFKPDMLVVDYINLMSVEKSSKDIKHMLFLKGKHLAEGLRYLADKYNICVMTVTQVDRSVWGGSDVKLDSIPESKAVAETADMVFSIIRNSEMKKHNRYKLKCLKLRDGENKEDVINFTFNPTYLTIENDSLEGSVN